MRIAVYGKGGIGKSTISSNISACIGEQGKKVLQIGCDPKHDSTRLLVGGREMTTVLDYLKNRAPQDCRLEDIVFSGIYGIQCVEAGGPEPGVGCAGRGILTSFETLERLGLQQSNYDMVLYDVLGDVVCGGFAVPLRGKYAQGVYIVTSGEFMSIYAANNILRGLKNYSHQGAKVGGIIFNSRGADDEFYRVQRFAKAVDIPILLKVPRSELFAESEYQNKCLMEAFPDSHIAEGFRELSNRIYYGREEYEANPLSDEELEKIVLGISAKKEKADTALLDTSSEDKNSQQVFSKSLLMREPLHGCAYSGAMSLIVQIGNCIAISHGPASCAHISQQAITSAGRRSLLQRGIVLPKQLIPHIESTDISEGGMVFGGMDLLRGKVLENLKEEPSLIVVVTTCPSGIIGDPVEEIENLSNEKTKVLVLPTDGNISGDFMQGMIKAYFAIGDELIRPDVEKDHQLVNLIGEKTIASSTEINYKILNSWFKILGLEIHCRYLLDTDVEKIRTMGRAGLNILAYDDYMGRLLRDYFEGKWEFSFYNRPLPVGCEASIQWIRELAIYAKRPKEGEELIKREMELYNKKVEEYRTYLQGKRLMIVSYNQNLDWIIRTALDVGMDIVKVGLLDFSQDFSTKSRYEEFIGEIELNYTAEKRMEDIENYRPDLVLGNYSSTQESKGVLTDTIPLCPEIGFRSGLQLLDRWRELLRLNLKEGWREDESLFWKYHSR